jgi:hypothetical protein
MRSLERTAQTVADRIKHIWSTVVVSLAGFAIGNLFRKAFEGAFEAAAEAQQRALSLTNEFWLHMRKEGYDAAAEQTKRLIAYNQKLAQTGVLGRGVFDAMADSLSKIGLAPKEIAQMEPILAGVLVRAKGITATAQDAADMGDTIVKAAKGGRLLGLMNTLKLPIGPSERERIKAYKDDWRGAIQYVVFLASKYKDFNVLMKNTPLGQIQRMRNAFGALARDIGETMLPAQADMAAAWEKALPEIKPAIIGVMSELATIMGKVAMEAGEFADRMAQTDAQDAANNLMQRFKEIWALLGFTPTEGSFGQLLASGFVAEARILNYLLDQQIQKFTAMKTILELVNKWMTEAFVSPIDAAIHRLQDFISLMTLGVIKPSKATQGILHPPTATAGAPLPPVMATAPPVAPPPDWIAKNPALLKAWMQGAAPSTAMTPDVRRNVEAAARAADRNAIPSVPYTAPPLPPAGRPPPPPTSRLPISPARPSIPIYGQPAGIGGGLGAPGVLPPGATMPYGPGGGAMPVPAGGAGPSGMGGAGAGGGRGAGGGGAGALPPMAGPAGPMVGALGDVRAKFADELKDPEVMRAMFQRMSQEVGTGTGSQSVAAQQAFAEELFNRAAARHQSLMYAIKDPHYYPEPVFNRSVDAATAERFKGILGTVQSGSNIANFATGNESGNVHSSGAHVSFASHGERFVWENSDVGWVRRMQQQAQQGADASRIAQANQPPPFLAANAYQAGGIAKTPQLAMLAEKGPEMVLPMATPSPLPSPPAGASSMGGLMSAMSPFLPYAQAALRGRFYAPSWMMGGKGQWMQGRLTGGAPREGSPEPSMGPFGEALRMPAMLGALSKAGRWLGETAADQYNLTHSPTIHIHGNADESAQRAIKIHLEDAHRKFIQDFKDAQRHERRLSYESGYSG